MSGVRVTKIRDFDVTPPRKSAFQIETPPDVPRQHSLTIFSARRGGGKSVACTTFVKKLLEVGAMQRVIIITPTWASNKDIFAPLNIQEEDVIEPSKTALATVVSRVEQEKKDHDEYLVKRRKYKEFQKTMRSATCIEAIPTSIIAALCACGLAIPTPLMQ